MPRKRNIHSEDYSKAFPTVLRSLFLERNITQQDLAEYLGKTRQAVSYYCDGSSSPDWETLVKIANYFSVTTDFLLGREICKTHDNQDIASKLAISEEAVEVLKYLATDIGEDFDYHESHPDMKWDFFNTAPLLLERLICSEWFIPFLNALFNCLTVNCYPTVTERLYFHEDKNDTFDYRFFSAEEKRIMDEEWTKRKEKDIATEKEKNITLSIFDVQRISCKIAEELVLASKQFLEDSNKSIAETVKNFYKARKKEGGNGFNKT